MVNEERVAWFGTHKGKELAEIPTDYLRWMTKNFDPTPMRRQIMGKSAEEAKALEDRMRNFLQAATKELNQRGES